MIMSTFEYQALFGNKPTEIITDSEIIEGRAKYCDNLNRKNPDSNFYTYKEVGIIIDDWGNEKVGIVERTGFEKEGF